MIRKALLKDIDELLKITRACVVHMVNNNIYQWNEFYPNKQVLINDIKRDELYALEVDNTLIGSVTISTFMDKEYIPIHWLTPNKNNIYIHRLAIHPKYQGKGFAQKLMGFAEYHAKKNHFISVRLDTFSQNIKNLKFYELRNYKRLGDIYFPKQSEFPFHCYELIL